MRSRTGVALAGFLLVMLVPGAARATQAEPASVALAVADDTVTIRSNDGLVGVLPLDGDCRVIVGGVVVAIVDGVLELTGGTAGDDIEVITTDGGVTINGGFDASDAVVVVHQNGDVATVHDGVLVDPGASGDGLVVQSRSGLLDLGPGGSRPS